jgi:putative hydrolase of the HAD superfamily
MPAARARHGACVWLFDLDNTLHNASKAAFPYLNASMTAYTQAQLGLGREEADALRHRYWRRYGATMLGLVRHHGVDAAHFLHHTHELPGLEARLELNRADIQAIRRLPGRRFVLTNSPMRYALRVLSELGIAHLFEGVVSIEDMRMFGQWRPKPDARSLRAVAVRLGVPCGRCVLVEDAPENLRAARRIGMHTVWLQRWLRQAAHAQHRRAVAQGMAPALRHLGSPAYVDQRVHHARHIRAIRV